MNEPLQRNANTDHLSPGTVLEGRYALGEVLAEGGFATVYQGRQINIDRPVAVKVLNLNDDLEVQTLVEDKFFIEARSSARIQHPNVVNIIDYGIVEQTRQPFIAMELLEGHHLRDEFVTHGAIEPSRAFALLLPCLEALGEAHRLGIIHRDLKPANLFIQHPGTEREMLKVLDFGVARLWAMQAISKTGNGHLLGSPRYLAPEYLTQNIATPALDVYQMGLIILEMLTGKPVIPTRSPYKCIWHHTHGMLDVPNDLMEGPLRDVILTALDMDHEARYPTADALRRALLGADLVGVETPGYRRITLASFREGLAGEVAQATQPGVGVEVKTETTPLFEDSQSLTLHDGPTALVDPDPSSGEWPPQGKTGKTTNFTPSSIEVDATALVEGAQAVHDLSEGSEDSDETSVWSERSKRGPAGPIDAPERVPEPAAASGAEKRAPQGEEEEVVYTKAEATDSILSSPTPERWRRVRAVVITASLVLGSLLFMMAVTGLVMALLMDV